MKKILRIATRNSPLALTQANFIRDKLLFFYPDWHIYLIPITTYGDTILNKSLAKIGGKGLFMKELEIALLQNQADIAIHSMKDVPVYNNKELCFSSICKRENALDAFISNHYHSIDSLPYGAKIGTSSLRRQCQLIAYRPDLIFIPLRGNIETRLKKLDKKKYDAIILAKAGLNRLGLRNRISQTIPAEISLPSCGQGAIGIQSRSNDKKIIILLKILNDKTTNIEITAERAFCKKLQSGCQIPVGSYAILKKNKLWLRGFIGLPDGTKILHGERIGTMNLVKKMGYSLAKELFQNGAKKILKKININNINIKNESINY
ncbi:Porphobilinogen deaminase [Buchnera aphidicola (Eriosoma grossulariae)]|uniref:hydroxymethylbilane synthase n=1 Tax=Buchnera aphidicola TaxID=9 RepID=UPI003463F390